jgi:glycosyltransferase involved in cell wall biosynthesis
VSTAKGAVPSRIAHILPWPSPGGTEHATLRIAKAVDSSRFASIAFCLPDAARVRALFTDAGIPCASYERAVHSYRHAPRFVRASLALARELERHQVDVVHCADLLAAHDAALAGWFARVPVVSHIRGRFDKLSLRDRSFLWPVDKFVFVSHNTWQHFGHHVPSARGTVVYDGIDVPPESGRQDDRDSARRELGIPERAPVAGMVARVAPPKDYATLAKAAARVLQAIPETRFLIVGDYTSTETHRGYYEQVRRVLEDWRVAHAFVFTGYRADVARLLSALDVFVLSTHWEGLPLVILEAMALARPVIATGVDGIPEIVEDEVTGLLFPREDDRTLAAHILRLLHGRAEAARIGAAGCTLVRTRFSTEQFAASMNVVYEGLTRSKATSATPVSTPNSQLHNSQPP